MEIERRKEIAESDKAMFEMVQNSLVRASSIWREIQQRSDATQVLKEGTFGDLGADQEVQADVLMGKALTRYLLASPNVQEVITEEGNYGEEQEGEYTVFVDPLDSSANAIRTLERLKLGLPTTQHDLPFGTVIAFAKNNGETIDDVTAAGFTRLDTGYSYIAVKDQGFYIVDPKGNRTKVNLSKIASQPTNVSDLLKNGWTFWTENYYPDTRTIVNTKLLKPDEKGYVRSQGCGANEQTTIAAGEAAAFFCTTAKLHEPAATILMVKEAGGVAVNPFTMEDAGTFPLRSDFRIQKQPLLLAMNKQLARDIHRRLTK
jgi:fructose-1,6-bisphosphatase/inositol monophosphatase family enzyme